ncbi:hypothetical protein EGI15_11280 [Chryseobacterium cucumeris]|uniref:SIR2-like domain-containing protein n=3 Tax=Chryseobacterium TaxID=59732 RepID=A0ABX9X783_9FLAO|nr:SIR2 family protein [Chryseobacterium cucumeris]ROH92794.1 hypothetical protein EGI15_11280 [Chryseobacterium cucumeris]
MEKRTIEDIAYLIKQAEKNKENKPIIFLGAGASVSAGIPLAGKIVKDILNIHKDKPTIQRLNKEERENYYKLMSALSAQERRNLFADYINNKNVKLNVTHIYLAQLLKEGCIDYILTVNFDDLMLKACALFNFIPPVYDVSVLNDFTTTNFLERSVTYLHGQHHGQWLLNAEGELSKVRASIPKIFDRICHNRTWIVIGYSGEDELVNEIAKIGSFENELYWVGHNEKSLSEKVKTELFDRPRMNAYHIQGYDSDSFFLKLHSELKLKTPEIFNKPFSFLNNMMDQVTDIVIDEKSKHKGLFNGIKDRVEISKKQVGEAIVTIENKEDEDTLIQKIIEMTIKEDFSIENAEEMGKIIIANNYNKAKEVLGDFYNDWAVKVIKEEGDNSKYGKALDLLNKANSLNVNQVTYFNNWGIVLTSFATMKKSKELFNESFDKFKMALDIDPQDITAMINWAYSLSNLAYLENSKELYEEAFEKYEELLKRGIDEKDSFVFDTWANSLLFYYYLIEDEKIKDDILNSALEKAQKGYENGSSPYNLACAYSLKNETKKALSLLNESLDKNLITVSHIEKDKDWDNFRKNKEFIDLLDQYR